MSDEAAGLLSSPDKKLRLKTNKQKNNSPWL